MKTDAQKLKICILGSTYPRHDDDPEVPWLRKSVNLLAARGHDVTVAVPAWKGLKSHTIDGIRVLRFRYAPKSLEILTHDQGAPNKLHNPLYNLLALPYIVMGTLAVAWWAAREKFDLINVHWPFPHGIMTIIPARIFGVKVVSTCHGAELALGRKKPWVRKVLGWLLRRVDARTCNSSHTAAEALAASGCSSVVVPYGATTGEAPAGEAPVLAESGEPATLLFSGRLIQRKGIPYLLKALPIVLQERRVRLFITGNGDRRQEWEALVRELGLQEEVRFLGFVTNEELGRLYRTCDMYVHPAIFDDKGDTEGLGVVLVEALMNERPVVASAVGGIVDVIKHEETGLLVPEKNEKALALAILRLLKEPALGRRLGRAGREFAEWHFDWNRITDELESLFEQTVRRPASVQRPHRPNPVTSTP